MAEKQPDPDSEKARQILAGARETFFGLGYEGASVGEIARRAGVSKATLYSYFADKAQLFDAVVHAETERHACMVMAAFEPTADVQETIFEMALRLTTLFCSPVTMALYRLCIAEGPRFPNVARAVYEHGPDAGSRRLAQYLAVAHSRGQLYIEDFDLAAHHLAGLCRALLFERLMFGLQPSATPNEIKRIAEAAAQVFLRAYAPRG